MVYRLNLLFNIHVMKKLLLLIILSLCVHVKSYSQGAAIVNDPLNASINGAIRILTEGSQKLNQFMSNVKALEMATDALESLQSIQEIAKLIDDLACLTTEFQALASLQTNYSCIKFLNFRIIDLNLKYSTELLTGVLLTKNLFTMTSEARLSQLAQIKQTLEKTIQDMQVINSSMKTGIVQSNYKKRIQKHYYAGVANSFSYNRYK